jgi:hypothetical protein
LPRYAGPAPQALRVPWVRNDSEDLQAITRHSCEGKDLKNPPENSKNNAFFNTKTNLLSALEQVTKPNKFVCFEKLSELFLSLQ